jgi:hypothetical protein
MMSDGGHAGLGEELRDGHAERDVHGDGDRVLDDEHFDVETADELVERALQVIRHDHDAVGHHGIAAGATPDAAIDPGVFLVTEKRFRHAHADLRVLIDEAGIPKAVHV